MHWQLYETPSGFGEQTASSGTHRDSAVVRLHTCGSRHPPSTLSPSPSNPAGQVQVSVTFCAPGSVSTPHVAFTPAVTGCSQQRSAEDSQVVPSGR